MFQYRQILARMRQGDTDREIARARLMGRRKAGELRELARERNWLDAATPLPEDAQIAAALAAPRRAASTISSLEPYRTVIERWFAQGVPGTAMHAALKREHGYAGSYSAVRRMLALLRGRHWLNFGSTRAWDAFVYFLIAPLVGTLMLRRHERARFSVYVFLSCEILRAWRIHSPALGVLAFGAILYLQTPAVRRIHPSVDPRRVLERVRLRRR